jgi:acetylornithine deacetylase/succinyl-diaminopimelate desuccinylase-like protein
MQAVYDYIDAHADEYVEDLQTLVRQPSISAQGIGLRECAVMVRDMMHGDGLDADLYELNGGPPVVYGHMTTPQSQRTMLCYAHYDVQPPEPLDAWRYGGPWSAEIVDGVMYGRGCSDNKSGILAFTKAAQALLKIRGELPVNLKFIT